MACVLYEIRLFAFIRIHCLDVGENTVTCAVGETRIFAFVHVEVEESTVAGAVVELRIPAFVHVEVEESTMTCAVGDIRVFAFCHDPLHDDVFLIYMLRRTVTDQSLTILTVSNSTVQDFDILLLKHYVRKLSVSFTKLMDEEELLRPTRRLYTPAASDPSH